MKKPQPGRVKTPPSGVTLWNPEIVLARSLDAVTRRAVVTVAEPSHTPLAVRARLQTAESVLDSLSNAHRALGARAAEVHARSREARSEQEEIAVAMDSYRVEAAVDDMLAGTFRTVRALMEERGLR